MFCTRDKSGRFMVNGYFWIESLLFAYQGEVSAGCRSGRWVRLTCFSDNGVNCLPSFVESKGFCLFMMFTAQWPCLVGRELTNSKL